MNLRKKIFSKKKSIFIFKQKIFSPNKKEELFTNIKYHIWQTFIYFIDIDIPCFNNSREKIPINSWKYFFDNWQWNSILENESIFCQFFSIEWNKKIQLKNMKSRKIHNCFISIKTLNKCYFKLKIVNGKFLDFQLLNFKLKIILFFQTILFLFYYFLALCGVQFQISVIFFSIYE